jgi:hypothetical protein
MLFDPKSIQKCNRNLFKQLQNLQKMTFFGFVDDLRKNFAIEGVIPDTQTPMN